jgi:hypothetical protein
MRVKETGQKGWRGVNEKSPQAAKEETRRWKKFKGLVEKDATPSAQKSNYRLERGRRTVQSSQHPYE